MPVEYLSPGFFDYNNNNVNNDENNNIVPDVPSFSGTSTSIVYLIKKCDGCGSAGWRSWRKTYHY